MFQHSFISLSGFFCFFFQLLQRVHGHEKELQNTQKDKCEHWDKTPSQAPAWLGSRRATLSERADVNISHWFHNPAEMCNADHQSAFWAPGFTRQKEQAKWILFVVGIQIKVRGYHLVWWEPKQKEKKRKKSPFIYKTWPKGRFPVSHEEDRKIDNTLQAALWKRESRCR